MIQRIQSVFLFASLVFLIPMFFMPVAGIVVNGQDLAFNLTGFFQANMDETVRISNQYSIMALGILICVLNLITIFMYKRRVLQLRLCIYNILLLVGLIGVLLFILYGNKEIDRVNCLFPSIFPLVSVIFHYLAFRGIRKDELMVQAMSRLR